MKSIASLLTVALLFDASSVFSQSLDPVFGNSGKVVTPCSSGKDILYGAKLLPDGNVMACGTYYVGTKFKLTLAKYNPGGSLNTNFGTNGMVITDFGGTLYEDATLAIQDDGKILLAGTHETTQENYDLVLLRFNADGSTDTGFGNNGTIITDFITGDGGGVTGAKGIVLQPDQKIIVFGYTNNSPVGGGFLNRDFAVARYNPDGSADTTFGTNGECVVDITGIEVGIGPKSDTANSLILEPDGKLIIAGYTQLTGVDNNLSMIRLQPDGNLDNTFGTNGKMTHDFGARDRTFSLMRTPDSKYIVVGNSYVNDNFQDKIIVGKFNSDGSLDNSFGNNGTIDHQVGTELYDRIMACVLLEDGKILTGGSTLNNGQLDFLLLQFNADGSIDNAFPVTTTDFSGFYDVANAMILQDDGKIILAGGSAINGNSNYDFALARYVVNPLGALNFDQADFRIYPNPATSVLNISGDFEVKLATIYSTLGQQVKISRLKSIDIADLPQGCYFAKIETATTTETIKFVKN